jgi:hypothetical protein
MEAMLDYRVTIHQGRRPDGRGATVIFRHPEQQHAMVFYRTCTPPRRGYVISVWRPDGTLLAFMAGPAV